MPPFPDTILIVDEVDELIVDGKPTSNYVKKDHDRSTGYSEAVTSYPNRPPGIEDSVWNLYLGELPMHCVNSSAGVKILADLGALETINAIDQSGRT